MKPLFNPLYDHLHLFRLAVVLSKILPVDVQCLMHVLHCFVGLASLEGNQGIRELTLCCEHVMRPELHLKEVKYLV